MTARTRLTTAAVVLLVGAATAACGGGGAPESASKDDFCTAQASIFENLDIDVTAPDGGLPSEKEMADAIHTWADRIEEVGTPKGISDDARKGFEQMIDAASDISEDDLKSPDLDSLEKDMSADEKKQVDAYNTYVTDTCGSMLGDLETPEVPDAG